MSTLQDLIGELKNQGDLNRNSGTNSQKAIKDILSEQLSLLHHFREDMLGYGKVLGGLTVALEATIEDDLSLQSQEDEKERIEREKKQLGLLEEIALSLSKGAGYQSDDWTNYGAMGGNKGGVGLIEGMGAGAAGGALAGWAAKLKGFGNFAKRLGWIGLAVTTLDSLISLSNDEEFMKNLSSLKETVGQPILQILEGLAITTANGITGALLTTAEAAAQLFKGDFSDAFTTLFMGSENSPGIVGIAEELFAGVIAAASDIKIDGWDDLKNKTGLEALYGGNLTGATAAMAMMTNPFADEEHSAETLLNSQDYKNRLDEIEALRDELDRLRAVDQGSMTIPERQAHGKKMHKARSAWLDARVALNEDEDFNPEYIQKMEDTLKTVRVFNSAADVTPQSVKAFKRMINDNAGDEREAYTAEYNRVKQALVAQGVTNPTDEQIIAGMDRNIVAEKTTIDAQLEAADRMRTMAEAGTLPADMTHMAMTEQVMREKGFERTAGTMFNYTKGGETSNNTAVAGDTVTTNNNTTNYIIHQGGGREDPNTTFQFM